MKAAFVSLLVLLAILILLLIILTSKYDIFKVVQGLKIIVFNMSHTLSVNILVKLDLVKIIIYIYLN